MVIPVTAPHPHSAADLAMAPVLISLERNLERLRDSRSPDFELTLELNDDSGWYHTPADRAERIRRSAIRDVDLHGWQVRATDDLQGLAVEHGAYRVSLMLGDRLAGYIRTGALPDRPPRAGAPAWQR